MGQKVNPHGLRVGVIKDWDSRWFAKDDAFGEAQLENGKITIDFSKVKREYGSSYTYTTAQFNLDKYVDNDEDNTTDYKGIMVSFTANVTAKSYSKNASVKVLDGAKDTENGGFDSFATIFPLRVI